MPEPDPRFGEITELCEACKQGDVERARKLLAAHPEVLNSPDHDTRFFYPASCLWSPLGLAAWHGREELVRFLLDARANPVPFEVAAQYHQHVYEDWPEELRERGYHVLVDAIEAAIHRRYGPPLDEANIRKAVREGGVERVRALIAGKPERVRQVDAVGNAPLHLAVAANNLEMVRLLAGSGSPLDARNGNGRTPAVIALFGLHRWWRNEEKPEILDLLLKRGAEYTILIAATRGDEVRVREILRGDASLANAADPCCRRPLSGAASRGHANIVRLLLEHGAEPNAKEAICQGGLSLHEAAAKGFTEIVQLLLDKGAVPEHWVDSSGDSVFASQRHPKILHLMYSYGGTMELQVYAASHRIDVIAEVLKLQPSRANDVLPYGWDDRGSEELALNIMRLAIRYGARFEKASEWNLRWTALKYPKVYRLLQQHGANPDLSLRAVAGDMPRRYQGAEGQLRVIAFLVEECGANVNYRDDEGITPLAAASREGYRDIVQYLLGKGADPHPILHPAPPRAAEFTRMPDADEQQTRETILNKLAAEPDRYLAEYGRRFGSVFNADDAATLFEDYNRDRARYRVAAHPAATWIRDELFRRSVEEPAAEGKNRVAFSAGGNAAGKSTAIEFSGERTAAQAVLDSTFASPEHAERLIDRALARNKRVSVLYVARPLDDALAAMIERAGREGRLVSIDQLIASQRRAAETVRDLYARFKDDPRFQFRFVDNSGDMPRLGTVDLTASRDYTGARESLHEILDAEYRAGRISESTWDRIRGSGEQVEPPGRGQGGGGGGAGPGSTRPPENPQSPAAGSVGGIAPDQPKTGAAPEPEAERDTGRNH